MEIYYENPYLMEIKTKILEKGKEGDLFFIVPGRNLFYLGGGGQPEDQGWVDELKILRMKKREGKVFYFLEREIEKEEVLLRVNFERRFSFMQHHSAQHLITAIADSGFNLKTISFHLGEDYGLIDFEGFWNEKILKKIEMEANEKIRKSIPLSFNFYKMEEMEGLSIRSRGLPENFEGLVRVVEIEGIDKNTCGGLHIKNLSEIQMVKFIKFEKIKEGVRVFYKAGNKLLDFLEEKLLLEEKLKEVLKCSPEEFLEILKKWEEEKVSLKRNLKKIKEGFLSFLEGKEERYYFFPGADLDFLQKIGRYLSERIKEKTHILIGEDGENFYFFIAQGLNSQERAEEIFKKILQITGGKGGGKDRFFQGKGELGSSFDKLINFLKN